jgi:hypothetical protein
LLNLAGTGQTGAPRYVRRTSWPVERPRSSIRRQNQEKNTVKPMLRISAVNTDVQGNTPVLSTARMDSITWVLGNIQTRGFSQTGYTLTG